MKPQILLPDLKATTEIDILEEMLISEVDRLDQKIRDAKSQEEKDEADAEHTEAMQALASYREDPDPRALITIGYIPARKMTELDFRWVEAAKGQEDVGPFNADLGLKFMDVCREYVRAGVRGFAYQEKFDIEQAMDIFERNGWIYTLTNVIKDYNSLSVQKKTESSSKPGTSQESTTVTSAEINPTFSEQEDVTSPGQ